MVSSPSNPSPYSPELQTFIITKYDPLIGVVKALNKRLISANKEILSLGYRVNALEKEIHELRSLMYKVDNKSLNLKELKQEYDETQLSAALSKTVHLENNWLYSCKTGTPGSALQISLGYTPDQCCELDVADWTRETDMWIDMLENLPSFIHVNPPKSMVMSDLRSSVRSALIEVVKSEVLFIVRNVPGKDQSGDSEQSLILVVILVGAINEAMKRIDLNSSVNDKNSVIVVLEGENIGTKLVSGSLKLSIEPLN